MAYIGNQPISAAFLVDTFSGNGSTVNYTMTVAPANTSSIIVAITGVVQDPSTYAVNGTTLTFSQAPPTGTSNISVRYLGIPASGVTTTAYRTVTDITATSGQTTFTIPSYTVGFVDVFRNGVRLAAADYTATTGTTIVLVNGATVGDTITTVSFLVSSVLNAIPATAGSVGTTFLADGSVTRAKMGYAGAVLQVVQGTSTTQLSTTSTTPVDIGLSATITPTSTSSRVLALISVPVGTSNSSGGAVLNICRGSTEIVRQGVAYTGAAGGVFSVCAMFWLDSPSTTSPVTYKAQGWSQSSSTTCYFTADYGGITGETSMIELLEIAG